MSSILWLFLSVGFLVNAMKTQTLVDGDTAAKELNLLLVDGSNEGNETNIEASAESLILNSTSVSRPLNFDSARFPQPAEIALKILSVSRSIESSKIDRDFELKLKNDENSSLNKNEEKKKKLNVHSVSLSHLPTSTFIPVVSTTLLTTEENRPSDECGDTVSDCAIQVHLCNHPDYVELLARMCPSTCHRCFHVPPAHLACRDASPLCGRKKRYCTVSYYRVLMDRVCPSTCKTCGV